MVGRQSAASICVFIACLAACALVAAPRSGAWRPSGDPSPEPSPEPSLELSSAPRGLPDAVEPVPTRASPTAPPTPLFPVTREERAHAWQRTASTVNTAGHATVSAFLDRECAGGGAGRGPSVRGVLHGAAGVGPSAGWQRLWLVAVDAAGRPTCAGGDAFEVTVESADTRAVVDVVADLGRGLYELQVLLRRPGQFTVCSDLVGRGVEGLGANLTALPASSAVPVLGAWDTNKSCTAFPASIATPSAAAVESALATLRAQDPRCQRPDALMRGEWRRVDECTGRECVGDILAVRSGGWAWLSDVCVIRLFSKALAWRALRNEFLLGWGDSTLKQPLANLVEYNLGVPLLKNTFMESRAKKKPGFFAYRQYDVTLRGEDPTAPFRLVFAWGGCAAITGAPSRCPIKGVKNTAFVRAVAARAKAAAVKANKDNNQNSSTSRAVWPTVIITNHYVWRSAPTLAEELDNIEAGVRMLHATFVLDRPAGARAPLLLWMSPVAHQLDTHPAEASHLLHSGRAAAWAVERRLSDAFPFRGAVGGGVPSVRIVGRYAMTNPLHHGNRYVHFGVHYGSTKGMCMTGLGHREHYRLSQCVRDAWADEAMVHLWLTAMG